MDVIARICAHCGKSLEGYRADADHCSTVCRMAAYRKKHPPIVPGPPIGELIEAYRWKLHNKTAKARENFDRIAHALAPLAARPVLTVTAEEWEGWLTDATEGMAVSTKALWRGYVLAMLKVFAHFPIAAPPPRPLSPPVDRTAHRAALLAGAPMLKTTRARIVVTLRAEGFLPVEIQRLTLDDAGDVQAGPAAWGRRARPPIPPALQERLRDFALVKGIAPGQPLFPISVAAITELVRRVLRRASGNGSVTQRGV